MTGTARQVHCLQCFDNNCLTLPIVNVNTLPSHCHYVPLIHLRHTALYKCVFDLIGMERLFRMCDIQMIFKQFPKFSLETFWRAGLTHCDH